MWRSAYLRKVGTSYGSSFSLPVELPLDLLFGLSPALRLVVVVALSLDALLEPALLVGHPIPACLGHSASAILLVVIAMLLRARC